MALTVCTVTAPPAMAAVSPVAAVSSMVVDSAAAMAQLRMEDKGPDLSKGELVSEFFFGD